LAEQGMTADAWASALSVLGPERGLPAAQKCAQIEALILFERDGQVTSVQTDGFRQWGQAQPKQ
jgi:thiamine biosynthesis lipoprotein ApbE